MPKSDNSWYDKNKSNDLYALDDIQDISGVQVINTENKIFHLSFLTNEQFKSDLNKYHREI